MSKGLYLRGVMDLLGLSESAINKLVEDNHIRYKKTKANGKRVFDRQEIQNFKSTSQYRSLKKQKVLVYLRCTSKAQERTATRKIEEYCKCNNLKANIISQLDRERQEIFQQNYRSAINYIFEQTNIAGLIYQGQTKDVDELKKIFQIRKEVFCYSCNQLTIAVSESKINLTSTREQFVATLAY